MSQKVAHARIYPALRARAPDSPILARFAEVARLLTGDPAARPEDAAVAARALAAKLRVPGLAHYGMTASDLPALCAKAKVASSMKANPIALHDDELLAIAQSSL